MSLTSTSATLVCQKQRQPINNKIEHDQIFGETQDDLKEFFDIDYNQFDELNNNKSENQTTFFDIVLFYKNNKVDYPIIWVYAQNVSDVLSGLFTSNNNKQKRGLCKTCEEKRKKEKKRNTFGTFSSLLGLLYHSDK